MQVYKKTFNLLDLFQLKSAKTEISLLILIDIIEIIARQNHGVIPFLKLIAVLFISFFAKLFYLAKTIY